MAGKQIDPVAVAKAHAAAMAKSETTHKYIAGINGTTVNPMMLAAQAAPAYLAGIQRAYNNGKYVASLNNASFQGWKTNSAGPGSQRLASGAAKSQVKLATNLTPWANYINPILSQIAAMPNITQSDKNAREDVYIQAKRAYANQPH